MDPIRIGLWNNPPFLVANGSSFSGLLAPHRHATYYFIFNKANVTAVSLPKNFTDHCVDNGICMGVLGVLQQGHIDITRAVNLNGLTGIGENLTSAPGVFEDNCYLLYKRKLNISVSSLTFFDFIFSFKLTFWLTLLHLFGTFIITHSFIIAKTFNKSFISILWFQVNYILGQNFKQLLYYKKRWLFSSFIVALLFIGKILSISLQIGLVDKIDYLKMETFDDILQNNYNVSSLDIHACSIEFQNSNDKLAVRVRKKAHVYSLDGKKISFIYDYRRQDEMVTIENDGGFRLTRGYGCINKRKEEEDEPYSRSKRPIFHIMSSYFINKLNNILVNKLIITGLYAFVEFGIDRSEKLRSLATKAYVGKNTPPSCLDKSVRDQEMVPVPISLDYLLIPYTILFVGLTLACLSFFVQHFMSH